MSILQRFFSWLFSILKKLEYKGFKRRKESPVSTASYNKSLALFLACIAFDTYNIHNFNQLKKKYSKLAIAFFDKKNIEGFIIKEPKFFSGNADESVIVAFRGTNEKLDWLRNSRVSKKKITWMKQLQAHKGFVNGYNAVRKDILSVLSKLKPSGVHVTGHSLGGALATLCALDLKMGAHVPGIEYVVMYNFGSPRVGDKEFATYYNHEFSDSHRIMVRGDPVTVVPPSLRGKYKHVQKGCYLKTTHTEPEGILKSLALSIATGRSFQGIVSSTKALIKNHSAYIPALKEENGIKGKYKWFGTDY